MSNSTQVNNVVYTPSVAVIRDIQNAKEAIMRASQSIQNDETNSLQDIEYLHKGLMIALDNILKTNEQYDKLLKEIRSLEMADKSKSTDSVYYNEFINRLYTTLKNAVNSHDVSYMQTKFLPYMDLDKSTLTKDMLLDAINELTLVEIHKTKVKEQLAMEKGSSLPWYKRWFSFLNKV